MSLFASICRAIEPSSPRRGTSSKERSDHPFFSRFRSAISKVKPHGSNLNLVHSASPSKWFTIVHLLALPRLEFSDARSNRCALARTAADEHEEPREAALRHRQGRTRRA